MASSSKKSPTAAKSLRAKPPASRANRVTAPLSYLSRCREALATADGHEIDVWELRVPSGSEHLSDWAARFRRRYCTEEELDVLRNGTNKSRAEYLTETVFPDEHAPPGPGIRAADFSELLISDYLEFLRGYWVPREKYAEKASRNESPKGIDVLGFRVSRIGAFAPTDELFLFEVKAQLSGRKYSGAVQKAVDDSSKDYLKQAVTLHAVKRRLLRAGEQQKMLLVQRFQNPSDHPYVLRSGAAALLSDSAYDKGQIRKSTKVAGHKNASNLEVLVIRGTDLMRLVNALYQKAADDAGSE